MSRIAHEEGLDCLADALTAEDGPDDLAALVEKQLPERPVADPAHPRYRVLGYAYWFRTGFGSEAMRAVSGQEDAVESLFELADEDLVESTEEYSGTLGGLARRRFHVPVNALVTARRAAERFGTWQQGRRADHAAYYLRFARQQITALSTREQWTALLALCSESDNLEAALTYLLDVGSDADVTEALKTLLPIWNRYKPAHGARNLLAAVLDRHLTTSSAELEPLKVVLADTFARRGESETAGTLLDEIASSGASARVRGLSAVASNPEEGVAHLHAALAAAQDSGPVFADTALDLGWAEYFAARADAAMCHVRLALTDATLRGDDLTAGRALLAMSVFVAAVGEEATALGYFERATAKLRRTGNRVLVSELAELAGSCLVRGVAARAANTARMLGACYVWLTPEHYCGESSVADREYEIAALIGDEEYTALFREGACSTPFEVLGLLARCRFGGDPPGVIADGGPPRTVAAPVSPHRDGTDGRAAETHLTVRELEVARLVAEGLTNRQVARRLGISQWTAVNHLRQVMRKLECTSRVQVAGWIHASAGSAEGGG
ncbi:hypothetical protein GCM10009839_52300 [Catenulispora yoronensis]|uniref:HTH luxR-type domain-containing protein n=2 Tax=Catenulispora yoronensis TaxID=450799 RepID=A0ABN2USY6_9ACTN